MAEIPDKEKQRNNSISNLNNKKNIAKLSDKWLVTKTKQKVWLTKENGKLKQSCNYQDRANITTSNITTDKTIVKIKKKLKKIQMNKKRY